jgi:nucleoside-diphosphate-sugar epimerase
MVVPKFVTQALAERPLTVFGDGTQTRCFCHVEDLVQALVGLMALGDAAHGEVFNIGSLEEISIFALAQRVRDLTGSDSEIVLVPYDEAYEAGFEDMPRRVPDLAKIEAALGWTPTRALDEILADVVTFQQAPRGRRRVSRVGRAAAQSARARVRAARCATVLPRGMILGT